MGNNQQASHQEGIPIEISRELYYRVKFFATLKHLTMRQYVELLLDEMVPETKDVVQPGHPPTRESIERLKEFTNILWKKVRRNAITATKAHQAAMFILELEMGIYHPINPEISIDALEIAHTYNLPATYDAYYLALAEREQCEFWTTDERLYNSVKGQLSWVRLINDLAPISLSE